MNGRYAALGGQPQGNKNQRQLMRRSARFYSLPQRGRGQKRPQIYISKQEQ